MYEALSSLPALKMKKKTIKKQQNKKTKQDGLILYVHSIDLRGKNRPQNLESLWCLQVFWQYSEEYLITEICSV